MYMCGYAPPGVFIWSMYVSTPKLHLAFIRGRHLLKGDIILIEEIQYSPTQYI